MQQPCQDAARKCHPKVTHHHRTASHFRTALSLFLAVLFLAGCFSTPTPQPTPRTAGELYRSNYTATPSLEPSLTPTATEVVSAHVGTPIPESLPKISPENAPDLIQVAGFGGGILQGFAWSPDSKLLAVATTRSLAIYTRQQDGESLKLYRQIETEGTLRCMAFSSDSKLLAVGEDSGWITVYHPGDGSVAKLWQASNFAVLSLAYAPTGELVSTAWDGALRIWDPNGNKIIEYGSSGEGWIEKMIFSSDGMKLFAWSSSRPLGVFDLEKGRVSASFIVNRSTCQGSLSAAFSASGEVIATGCDGEVRAFSTADGYSLGTFTTGGEEVRALAISPAGDYLAFADAQTISLYRLSDDSLIQQLTLESSAIGVIDLAFSPDNTSLGILGDGLTLWNTAQIALIRDVHLPFRVDRIAVSSEGKWLAGWRSDSTQLRLLEVASQTTRTNSDSLTPVIDAAFSTDGSLLAVAADALRLLDSQTGQTLAELTAPQEGASYRISVFHEDSGITTIENLVNQAPLASAAFSPDGLLVAAGGYNRAAYLWDLPGGDPRQAILKAVLQSNEPFVLVDGQPDSDWIKQLAFSSDGKTLAVYRYGTMEIWDVQTGALVFSIPLGEDTPSGQPCHLSFTEENSVLLAAWESTSYRYDLQSGNFLEAAPSLCGMPWAKGSDLANLALPGAALHIPNPMGYADPGSLIYLPTENTLTVERRSGRASVVQFWRVVPEAVSGSLLDTQPISYHTSYALSTALLSETGQIAQVWEDGSLLLSDPSGGTETWISLALDQPAVAAAIDPSGKWVAFAAGNGVLLWDTLSGATNLLQTPGKPGDSLAFRPDGSLLAASLNDQTLLVWRTADGSLVQSLNLPATLSSDQAILFSGDGAWLAARTNAGITLWGWDENTAEFSNPSDPIAGTCLALSTDGSLAAVCAAKQVEIYQLSHAVNGSMADAQLVKTIPSVGGSLAFSPDNRLLAVLGLELSLWDIQEESALIQIENAPSYGSLFFSSAGDLLAAATADGRIVLYGAP